MRLRRVLGLVSAGTLTAASAAAVAVPLRGDAVRLRVNDAATRLRMFDDRFEARLVVQNSTGVTLDADADLELLDPADAVRAGVQQRLRLEPGLGAQDVVLSPGVSSLSASERLQVLHYRLRYRLAIVSPPPGASATLTGVLAVSRLTPDVFELRLLSNDSAQAARPLHVVVQAVHPVSERPVAGVEVRAELRLDEEEQRTVAATHTTDGRGLAIFRLRAPGGIASGRRAGLSAVGRRAGLVAKVTAEVQILRFADLFVSTDKPLYQPGQPLRVRVLARAQASGPALVELPLELSVLDEAGDRVFETSLRTSRFGVASADWPIPEHARQGRYSVAVEIDDAAGYEGSGFAALKVSRYELPQFAVRAAPDKPYYLFGEKPRVELQADYLFGKPVTRGRARVVLETRREWNFRQQRYEVEERGSQEGPLRQDGRFAASFELAAEDFPERDDWQPYRDIEGTAYVTDATTGRTEERRFTLRATLDPIHLYVVERYAEPCEGDEEEDQTCRASFYVSASYADGTPAEGEVQVARRLGPAWDWEPAAEPAPTVPLFRVKTGRFGLAKVPAFRMAPLSGGQDGDHTWLALSARDEQGRRGRWLGRLGGRSSPLLVEAERTIRGPGQPIEVTIDSRSTRGPLLVDVVSGSEVLASRVVSLRGSSTRVLFPYEPRFRGALQVKVTSVAEAGSSYADGASAALLYPSRPELRVRVRSEREMYRPGDEATLRFALEPGDGRPAAGVLGLVVFDKAIEERAAAERGLWQPAGFLAAFADDDRVGGVSLGELLALDAQRPSPPDLDLVAEVALARQTSLVRRRGASDAFDRDTPQAFRRRFEQQLTPVAEALSGRFEVGSGGPRSLSELEQAVGEGIPAFRELRDPWERPYRLALVPRDSRSVAEVRSDGPDRAPGTGDEIVALSRGWHYFAPRGRLLERAARAHHHATGSAVQSLETLRAELARLGEAIDDWRDPWGNPFRFEFSIAGPRALIVARSAGPNGVFERESSYAADDVTVSTVGTDYFGRERRRIQQALDAWLASGGFPGAAEEWVAALRATGLAPDSLHDPWGRPLEVLFRTDSAYANEVSIRAYAELSGERTKRVMAAPLSRSVEVISLWSRGADGESGSRDDFELAAFRRTVAEVASAVATPAPVAGPVLEPGRGAIVGTVTDTTGAVIPGATVTAKASTTGEQRAVLTDAKGDYAFAGLWPGSYLVSVALAGFRTAAVTHVPVEQDQQTRLDVVLEVGALSETVEVSAGAPAPQTQTSSIAGVVESGRTIGGPRPAVATPRVRRDFPETLYWQPALETDEAGRARVSFKLADTLTSWKLAVVASTTSGQIATAERELRSFQPFFVENDPPPVLTVGDAIGLPGLVRNYTERTLRVALEAAADSGLRVAGPGRQELAVPAGEAAHVRFDLRADAASPSAKVILTARGGEVGDAVEKAVAVRLDGAESERGSGAFVDREAVLDLDIPAHALAGSLRAELRVAPHLSTHVLESVEAVMQMPYGCAEQTISSAYPSLLALRLIGEGKGHEALAARARRYLGLGHERLLGYQQPTGSFEYFHGQGPDLALTAYALRFLADARGLLDVDPEALARARSFLLSQQEADGRWPARRWYSSQEDESRSAALTALVARTLASLSRSGSDPGVADEQGPPRAALDRALAYLRARSSEREDPYALATFALAAHAARAAQDEEHALARLSALARREGGGSYWAYEVNTPFYGWGRAGRVETTALAVQALAASGLERVRPLVEQGLLFLLRNRDRGGIWWSGQATVNVLEALVTVIGGPSPAAGDDPLEVVVDGRAVGSVALPVDASDTRQRTFDLSAHVSPGAHRVELRRARGGGRITAQAVASYFVPWAEAPLRTSDALRLDVRFDRRQARVGEAITVHIEAERVGFQGYGMLLAEIGLPPAVDVDRESLERAVASSGYGFCSYDVRPDRVVAYLWPRAGGLKFDFIVRPRLPMQAQSARSILYDYYNPEAAVTQPPQVFVVQE